MVVLFYPLGESFDEVDIAVNVCFVLNVDVDAILNDQTISHEHRNAALSLDGLLRLRNIEDLILGLPAFLCLEGVDDAAVSLVCEEDVALLDIL